MSVGCSQITPTGATHKNEITTQEKFIGEDLSILVSINNKKSFIRSNSTININEYPEIILICPLGNGIMSIPPFEVYDINKKKFITLNTDNDPLDEVVCLVSNDQKYMLIHDPFEISIGTYIFNNKGKLLKKIENKMLDDILDENKEINFSKSKSL